MEVSVLYEYSSSTASGKSVSVWPGETYRLLDDRDPWIFVTRALPADGFYLPKNYVAFPEETPKDANKRHSTAFQGASLRSAPKGFKIGDARLAAKSIPQDVDCAHNIHELGKAQDLQQRLAVGEPEDGPLRPATALPRPHSALLPPNAVAKGSRISVAQDLRAEAEAAKTAANGDLEPTYEHIANGHSPNGQADREYQNLEDLRKTEKPPEPRPGQSPLREMEEGWAEFEDSSGRTFFHHRATATSTWKPPRLLKSPAEVAATLASGSEESRLEESGYNSLIANVSSPDPASVPPPPSSLPAFPPLPAGSERSDLEHSLELAAVGTLEPGSPAALKRGPIDFARYVQQGKKLKKAWSSAYVFLTSAHLILYKDEAASKKKGSHYSAPLGVCDLRGARLEWKKEKEGRRRHVFLLRLLNHDVWLWSASDEAETTSWFSEIGAVVGVLPQPEPYPQPPPHETPSGSLRRRSSGGWGRGGSVRVLPTPGSSASPPASPTKGSLRGSATPMTSSLLVDESPIPESRDSILEKLRKLFRSRPTIDTLREKGIYKPEPVFGSSLAEICKREETAVPRFVRVCTAAIERKGLDYDGLYRISGNLSQIQRIRCQVDQDSYGLLEGEEDVHVLSGALKLFFRELQEPLFPQSLSKDLLAANKVETLPPIEASSPRQRLGNFAEALRRMPAPNGATLELLLRHLLKVAAHSAKNRMQIHNLAIVFGPTLFTAGSKPHQPAKGKAKAKSKGWRSSNSPSSGQASGGGGSDDVGFSSNSHLAFNMIMQGQILEFLLKEYPKLYPSATPP